MPRVRVATRWPGREFDLVNVTENGETVFQHDHRDLYVFDQSRADEMMEVRCERCGTWSHEVAPAPPNGRWVCHHRRCYGQEASDA